jgi:anti-sigma B factor antagonist
MDNLDEQLNIEVGADHPDQRLLVVRGEIEFQTAPKLRAAIGSALDDNVRRLVLDLRDVTFIDSTGLAVLVEATMRTDVSLRRPSPVVERVIALTGLSSTLDTEHAT